MITASLISATKATRIKLCGFTRLADVQAAVALNVDYIGFVFYAPSPRYIALSAATHLVDALPARTLSVGLFVNHTAEQVIETVQVSGVKVLQFHGTESEQFCDNLSQQLGLPYWKAIHISPDTHSDDLLKSCQTYPSAQALLFDTASLGTVNHWGGTGHTFEWQKLAPLAALNNVPPLVLSGGLSAQNVAQGIAQLKPWAVDISSGIEAIDAQGKPRKGIKDPLKMAQFVHAVRST